MKNFKVKADIIVVADDLDEVFYLLARHFLDLLAGQLEEGITFLGNFEIEPITETPE